MGAGRVIVVDHLEYRLEKARTFAHAETYNFAEYDDIVVHLKKETDYLGADVVIDAVGAEADGNFLQHVTSSKLKLQGGSPIALNWAIDSVRKGGTVSVVGAPDGTITHTVRGTSSALTRPASVLTSDTVGSRSKPTTSCPARRIRSRMLPPILPRPIRPSCM